MGGVRQRRFMAPPATRVKVEERARLIAAGEDPDPDLVGPGADGHCGIEGLSADEATKKKAKLFFKRLRLALADKATLIEELAF
jgi:hypothetical protein